MNMMTIQPPHSDNNGQSNESQALAPESVLLAWLDWAVHLAASPAKCTELGQLAISQNQQLAQYLQQCLVAGPGQARSLIEPPFQERRFAAPEWRQWPFNLLSQNFLLQQRWWEQATHEVPGLGTHHQSVVAFWANLLQDMCSPRNTLLTNPVVLQRTVDEGGANLVRGMAAMAAKLQQLASGAPAPVSLDFVVGRDIAITPGKVVLQNRLIELIQYSPTTAKVHPEPILIVPAWIMKYYILDLSPHNSLIRYLVEQGHTVFCISWKNPGSAERELDMDDYLELGFEAALGTVNAIVPQQKVHATGYCLGGTLLSIAAAAMAARGDERLASVSLFAAQTDFSEPGGLGVFIDENQLRQLDAQMAVKGYLSGEQMASAFQMMRSSDLLWMPLVNSFLMGDTAEVNDLMAWNSDATRMPANMHSQYLRRLYLNNDLSAGRYPVAGKPVALGDIALPVFCVGTVADHVAPWHSVYKLHAATATEITFVLTSGGHNAGIVSEPGHPHHNYQIKVRPRGGAVPKPDDWVADAEKHDGSWWPQWVSWLQKRSSKKAAPPELGGPEHQVVGAAPGTYVMEK
jgi:polyhydroxyalkanoate synthase